MQLATAFSTPAAPHEEEALSLSALAQQYGSGSVSRFRQVHGDSFFLHVGGLPGARQPQGFLRTINYDAGANAAPGGLLSSGCVYPVKATGRCPFPNFVSIGRTRNNDVVLPDLSISKFHAYLRPDGDHYNIQDAGSQNGTWLDGRRLTPKESVPLRAHLVIRLGALDLTYLDAASLHQMLTSL